MSAAEAFFTDTNLLLYSVGTAHPGKNRLGTEVGRPLFRLTVTEFRRQCLSLLDHLPAEGVVITKHGQPVAKIIPLRQARTSERMTLPLLEGKVEPGPHCPDTETPYDRVFD